MSEVHHSAHQHSTASDANQIVAAVACDLLLSKRQSKQSSFDESKHAMSTFQPELDSLAHLTRQIQELQLATDAVDNSSVHTKRAKPDESKHSLELNEQLASLHCQRAQSILECVDFDASALLSASFFSDVNSSEDSGCDEPEQNDREDHRELRDDQAAPVNGVERALDDALAAIALAPASATGYFIAAQCARSLEQTSRAIELATLAHQFASENADIQQLAKQLAVDAKQTSFESLAPSLMTSPQLLSAVFDTPNQEQQQQQQQDDQPEDHADDDAEDSEILYQRLLTGHQTLATIASSSWLHTLEQMMHQNVHHQCAARDDIRDLNKALSDTVAFLCKLLESSTTTSALGLDHVSVQEMLAVVGGSGSAATTSPPTKPETPGHHLLVENRALRKWVGQTLAPAVRRFLSTLGRALSLDSLLNDTHESGSSGGYSSSKQQIVAVTLVRDALLVLTRVLLATAGWRRCTSMAHALLYAELCFDLAKEVGAAEGSFSGLSRFEMICSDVYARALLELTTEHNDALQLHQESLQVAMTTKDVLYEVRSHHLVAQTHTRLNELDLARAEFTEMLQLSQALGDSPMECLAQYELGECCVRGGNLPQAQTHFKLAQTLCHQSGRSFSSTWRPQSVQQAIAFYAAMKPARRGAIRIAPSKPRHRRGSLAPSAPPSSAPQQHDELSGSSDDTSDAPKLRRPAIWIGPPKLTLEPGHDGKRSLLKTLLGEQTEPLEFQNVSSGDGGDSSKDVAHIAARTATAKLFASSTAASPLQKTKPETPKRGTPKPRRNGAWRDSVFAIPPSYAELKSLASSSLLSPVRAVQSSSSS